MNKEREKKLRNRKKRGRQGKKYQNELTKCHDKTASELIGNAKARTG